MNVEPEKTLYEASLGDLESGLIPLGNKRGFAISGNVTTFNTDITVKVLLGSHPQEIYMNEDPELTQILTGTGKFSMEIETLMKYVQIKFECASAFNVNYGISR